MLCFSNDKAPTPVSKTNFTTNFQQRHMRVPRMLEHPGPCLGVDGDLGVDDDLGVGFEGQDLLDVATAAEEVVFHELRK